MTCSLIRFVHFIDAPSLALILPVVQRSFRDNSTETRKMAAQIIGNMYSLTDEKVKTLPPPLLYVAYSSFFYFLKDLKPYLPSVVPGLKGTLLDPMPEVRAIASKALGAMVRVSGESQFEELMPWLIEHLTSEQTSVDRWGVVFCANDNESKNMFPGNSEKSYHCFWGQLCVICLDGKKSYYQRTIRQIFKWSPKWTWLEILLSHRSCFPLCLDKSDFLHFCSTLFKFVSS